MTICTAHYPGFVLAKGDACCVDNKMYDYAQGCKIAKENAQINAENKIWELLGYSMADPFWEFKGEAFIE